MSSRLLRLAALAAVLLPSLAASQSAPRDSTTFAAAKWREIGPFRGGRSVAVTGTASRPMEFWFGTTGGGAFKSIDGGQTWLPVTDKYFGGSIGAIGVSESNPDIVYIGTGEYAIRGNVSHGDGVWKTTDAGKTWSSLGLAETQQISRVRVHPSNPDIVWVGAQGRVFGPNAERGVYKTTDGGKNWRKVLYRNDSTGVTDLVVDPTNPDVLYASFWQSYRKPWTLVSGGAGSGIFKSTDGGEHWKEITRNPGLPQGVIGQIGLSVSPVNPQRVFALIENDSGGVYRSDDGGDHWQYLNPDHRLRQRAWYYSRIFADTKDPNIVYALNTNVYRSNDGGKHFFVLPDPHGDNHDLWIAPNDNQRLIEANDGGANVSYNAGKTWTLQDFATAQFYHVSTTNHFPYKVCGAQQDNSGLCGPSRFPGGIPRGEWFDASGESGFIVARPDDPDITYGGDNSGFLMRLDHRNNLARRIDPWPDGPDSHPAGEGRYRFQWTSPTLIPTTDPHSLYIGGNVLFKTTNEGQSWTPISPDLTRHDPKTLGISGGPITADQTTAEYYATIFALAESPLQRGLLWVGSDDGLINISRNDGLNWTAVTPPNFGEFTRVSIIEPSHFALGTAYVAANRYQMNDDAPYIYKTTDFGKTWTRIDAGLPATEFVRVVREDPLRRGLLFAGTERGVWVSFDDGGHWETLRRNLPIVPVHDLVIKEGDLVAATHGRSFWILDDISALRQFQPAVLAKPLHVVTPRDAYRVEWGGSNKGHLDAYPVGANPPTGPMLYYWLKNNEPRVTLEILDAHGALIVRYDNHQDSTIAADSTKKAAHLTAFLDSLEKAGQPRDTAKYVPPEDHSGDDEKPYPQPISPLPRVPDRKGLNMFAWNMRYPRATNFVGMININTEGPMALPGTYWVRVYAGSAVDSARFTLKNDPRSKATMAELTEQFAFLMKVRDTTDAATRAVVAIRELKSQVDDRIRTLKSSSRSEAGVAINMATDLAAKLSAVEGELYQVKNQSGQDALNYPSKLAERVSGLGSIASGNDARPTAQTHAVFGMFAPQMQKQLLDYRKAMRDDLAKVNAALRAAGVREIVLRSLVM